MLSLCAATDREELVPWLVRVDCALFRVPGVLDEARRLSICKEYSLGAPAFGVCPSLEVFDVACAVYSLACAPCVCDVGLLPLFARKEFMYVERKPTLTSENTEHTHDSHTHKIQRCTRLPRPGQRTEI